MNKISSNNFETDFKASATKNVFIHRQRDVYIPPQCRTCDKAKIVVPKNPFDFLLFSPPLLILAELKSGKQKSFSFSEKIIKEHQIKSLEKSCLYNLIIPGFIFNFSEINNETYFLHINDFISFKNNTSRKSIPYDYIKTEGLFINNKIKKVNYKYDLEKFIGDVCKKYSLVF